MQSVYLAAQRKSQTLTESIEGFAVEGQKLTERLVSAEAQYLDGMRKTKAASRQLQSLAKEVHASEQAAHRKCFFMHLLHAAESVDAVQSASLGM